MKNSTPASTSFYTSGGSSTTKTSSPSTLHAHWAHYIPFTPDPIDETNASPPTASYTSTTSPTSSTSASSSASFRRSEKPGSVQGTGVGDQISPILANIPIRLHETNWQHTFQQQLDTLATIHGPHFFVRYVDNRLIIAPSQSLTHTAFTIELEIVPDNHFLGFDVNLSQRLVTYRQPTAFLAHPRRTIRRISTAHPQRPAQPRNQRPQILLPTIHSASSHPTTHTALCPKRTQLTHVPRHRENTATPASSSSSTTSDLTTADILSSELLCSAQHYRALLRPRPGVHLRLFRTKGKECSTASLLALHSTYSCRYYIPVRYGQFIATSNLQQSWGAEVSKKRKRL